MIYLKLNAKKYLHKSWKGLFIIEEALNDYILCLEDKEYKKTKKELEKVPNIYFYAGKWHKIKKIIILSRFVWNENYKNEDDMYILKKEKIITTIDEDGEI